MPMNNRLLRPRQTIHPEAADWANRVQTNGGTVSGTTLSAVDKFCKAIAAAGIRDRFYRLNLFGGNSDSNLAAVRTPLYRGPSLSGTQYGNATDTNNSFVVGDYAENDGLLGNTTTKWLNTGFNAATAGLATGSVHLSAVWPTYSHPASSNWLPISIINSNASDRCWINNTGTSTPLTEVTTFLGQSGVNFARDTIAAANGATIPGGLWVASRTGLSSLSLYNGSVERATFTGTIGSGALPSTDMSVFARWSGTATFGHFGARLRAYSVGLGMTAQQVSDFNTAMTALQTALGRT